MAPRRPVIPQFTPDEARVWQALVDLGDAARWGLLVGERVAAAEVREAHRRALALARHLGSQKI